MKGKKLASVLMMTSLVMVPMLSACGSGDSSSGGAGGADKKDQASAGTANKASGEKVKIKWATWGNPGELTRFQEFTKDFNAKHPNIEAELIPIPGEYEQKILTQLSGGTAPDVFYAGDGSIIKFIENGSIEELTPYFKSGNIQAADYFEGLWGAAKKDSKIYGITVDCNPMVLWYNKKVLKEAGITEDPAALAEAGQWNWAKFKEMTSKLKASKKYGYVLDNWWGHYYSWISTNGGNVYDDSGKFIGDTDPKAKEAWKYIYDNVKEGNFTFAGTLPKGQGADAMFMSNQVGFVGAGRWYLPQFKANAALEYDIAPWPTNTGKKMEPAGIPTAYITMNKATKNKAASWEFIQAFVSKEGQIFRLQGGGNAVPSTKGADQVVMEGNLPAHAKTFLDAREIGYALTPKEAAVPGLSTVITTSLEALWLKGGTLEDGLKDLGTQANKKIQDVKSQK